VRPRYLQYAVAVAGVSEILEAEVALALGELLAQHLLQSRARRAHHRPRPTPIARQPTATVLRDRREGPVATLVSGSARQGRKGLLYWCSGTAEIGEEIGDGMVGAGRNESKANDINAPEMDGCLFLA
jgi:hypothetical protein